MAVAILVHYAGVNYPATDAGLLAAGLVFFPVFVWQVNRKG